MASTQILVVDDNERTVRLLKECLERAGYKVIAACNGEAALDIVRDHAPAIIILDLKLPGISGWDVCRILRAESDLPIIILSGCDEDTDKIVGLELGADDYIIKPFNIRELVSRVRAVLRRTGGRADKRRRGRIEFADLSIDLERHQVIQDGKLVELTPTEFKLLRVLAEAQGCVYSRLQLLKEIQGSIDECYERTINSHIKNLRKKVEADPSHPSYIITVRGVGYKFDGGDG